MGVLLLLELLAGADLGAAPMAEAADDFTTGVAGLAAEAVGRAADVAAAGVSLICFGLGA